jgi:hypothetical protein
MQAVFAKPAWLGDVKDLFTRGERVTGQSGLGVRRMKHDAEIEDALDIDSWVDEMIAENGYAQLSLHDPSSGQPGLAFTLGLERSRAVPELLCLGVAPDVAAQLFGLCISGHDNDDCDLGAGAQTVEALLPGHALRMRPVGAPLVAKANGQRPARQPEIRAMVQVLLPDDAGLFPGEPGCDPRIVAAQDVDRLLAPAAVN